MMIPDNARISPFQHHARQNDESYWQYQDTLQQSSLSFQAMIHRAGVEKPVQTRDFTEVVSENLAHPRAHIPQPSVLHPETVLKPIQHALRTTDSTTRTTQPMMQQAFQTLLNSIPTVLNHQAQIQTKNMTGAKSIPQPIVFKNHHLFIQDDEADIALNTTALSDTESRALQQLVRQWLAQQGLTLKTLSINGMQQ